MCGRKCAHVRRGYADTYTLLRKSFSFQKNSRTPVHTRTSAHIRGWPHQVPKYLTTFALIHYRVMKVDFWKMSTKRKWFGVVWFHQPNESFLVSLWLRASQPLETLRVSYQWGFGYTNKCSFSNYKALSYPLRGKSRFYFTQWFKVTQQVIKLGGWGSSCPGVFFCGLTERKMLRKAPPLARTLFPRITNK